MGQEVVMAVWEARAEVGAVLVVVVVAHEVAWVAPGVAVEVVNGILEEVASTAVGGEVVTRGITVVDLSGALAAVVEDHQVLAVEVAIGAMTILTAAISRITVEDLSVVTLVVVVGEDLALIQVAAAAAADMAQVAEWEGMAEVGVGTEPAQMQVVVPLLVLLLYHDYVMWAAASQKGLVNAGHWQALLPI
jgi:hypothetical protein